MVLYPAPYTTVSIIVKIEYLHVGDDIEVLVL